MAITVQHGGSLGGAGRILAQSGLASLQREQQRTLQANQLEGAAARQQEQIQAQAQLQSMSAQQAMERTTVQAGLQEEFQQRQYGREVDRMKQQAKQDAQQYEYKYTSDQRHKFAEFENAKQAVLNNQNFSADEKQEVLRTLEIEQQGISNPTAVLAKLDQPKYSEGQGVGDFWINPETGDSMSREANGDPRVHTPYANTKAGVQAKIDADASLHKQDRRDQLKDGILRAKLEYLKNGEVDTGKTNAVGEPQYRKPNLNEADIFENQMLDRYSSDLHDPPPPATPLTEESIMQDSRLSPSQKLDKMRTIVPEEEGVPRWKSAVRQFGEPTTVHEGVEMPTWAAQGKELGRPVTQDDWDLPARVGMAQVALRDVRARFGKKIPEGYEKMVEEAEFIVTSYSDFGNLEPRQFEPARGRTVDPEPQGFYLPTVPGPSYGVPSI